MPRTSVIIAAEMAIAQASNTANQEGINRCSATLQELDGKISELNDKKKVLEDTYLIYSELKDYIVAHLAELEETCVCIQEIKSESVSQISDKIDIALKCAYDLVTRLDTAINSATEEYNTAYEQKSTYETNLSKGQAQLEHWEQS